jgi:hypothetical protein
VTVKGHQYYRRNRRVGGRVAVEHVGRGRTADAEAALDASTRLLRRMADGKDRADRDEFRYELDQVLRVDRWLAGLFGVVAHLTGHRRQWRRKRGSGMANKTGFPVIDALLGRLEPRRNEPLVELDLTDVPAADRPVIEAAANGDAAALAKAEAYLSDPKIARRWGNPAFMARCWLVWQVGGDDAVVRRAVWRQFKELNADLGWGGATPLEQLAISRVVHGWLTVNALEAKACAWPPHGRERQAVERALTQAERRYTQALRALAYLRRVPVAELAARVAVVLPAG